MSYPTGIPSVEIEVSGVPFLVFAVPLDADPLSGLSAENEIRFIYLDGHDVTDLINSFVEDEIHSHLYELRRKGRARKGSRDYVEAVT